jgi:hypothetical protein
MDVERTSTQRTWHSQKWMKKTEQPDMNEGTKNKESFTFFRGIHKLLWEKSCIYARWPMEKSRTYMNCLWNMLGIYGKILKKRSVQMSCNMVWWYNSVLQNLRWFVVGFHNYILFWCW